MLKEIYNNFSGRFERVVIAGGSVRDFLIGSKPKDYDVFILGECTKEHIDNACRDLEKADEFHDYEPYLMGSYIVNGNTIQVMATGHESLNSLVSTFDWNVSKFAYDGNFAWTGMQVDNIAKGKELKLMYVSNPKASIQRGYRFSERFGMRLRDNDLLVLNSLALLDSALGKFRKSHAMEIIETKLKCVEI